MKYPITGRAIFIQDGSSIDVPFSYTCGINGIIKQLCEFYKISPEQIVSLSMRNRKAIKAQKEEALKNYNLSLKRARE